MSAHSEVLPQERKHAILTRLRTQGRVCAAELAGVFDISEDSIRRDLRKLAAQGLCRRVYGGALLPSPPLSPFRQRQDENAPRKQALAKVAASLVEPNQVLLIDAGSANNAIAARLPERHGLTVATNAPSIAQQLMAREGFEVMLIGGRMDTSAGGSVGAEALEQLRRIRADLCFPGACAIDSARGLWGMDSDQAVFKRAMIEASDTCVVVVLNDKLETPAPFQVAGLHAIDYLVVEHDAPAAQVQASKELAQNGAPRAAGSCGVPVLYGGAGYAPLCASKELAQNGAPRAAGSCGVPVLYGGAGYAPLCASKERGVELRFSAPTDTQHE